MSLGKASKLNKMPSVAFPFSISCRAKSAKNKD